MFALLIKVCVGISTCYYSSPPVTYDSLAFCQQQAAIIAGLKSGQHPPGRALKATYRCRQLDTAQNQQDTWYEISLLAPKA
ncbi:MAG: hypothetical protein RIC87_17580 [Kiloniellales bacterium]